MPSKFVIDTNEIALIVSTRPDRKNAFKVCVASRCTCPAAGAAIAGHSHGRTFSLPAKRYLKRQSFALFGFTQMRTDTHERQKDASIN